MADTDNLTLMEILDHSDVFHPSQIWNVLKTRFKAVLWTIPERRRHIYLCREITGLKYGTRILRYDYRPGMELTLHTSRGTMKFFNP